MAQRTDDPSATPTAIVSVVFTILVVAIVIGLQALYGWAEHKTVADKVLNTPATAKNRVFAEQRQGMSDYGWADRDAGVVEIPIDRAMELVTDELNAGGAGE